MSETVGLIGLGSMGLPLATNLLESGYKLRVYNRTIKKAQPLAEKGAEVVQTPAEVVEPGGVVITLLANDQALEEVVLGDNGILDKLGPESIHLSMSTVSPTTAQKLADLHEKRGAHYIASPVFGRPDAVAARKLWICMSGNSSAKARVQPLLEKLGQGTFDFGEKPGAANVVKIAGNFMIISAIEAMAEAFTLAEKNGIDRAQVANLFGQTLLPAQFIKTTGVWLPNNNMSQQGSNFR